MPRSAFATLPTTLMSMSLNLLSPSNHRVIDDRRVGEGGETLQCG